MNDKPIAVLHAIGMMGSHRGGSSSAFVNLARATTYAGDRATVLTTFGDGDEPATDRFPPGVEVVTCRRQWPPHFSVSWSLAAWSVRNVRRFDLVEVHEVFAFPTLVLWLAARARGVPFVIHPHGSLEPYDMQRHARAKAILSPGLRRMVRDADAVWLATDREADNLSHLRTDFRAVVSALPVPQSPHPGDGGRFRRRHGLGPQDRVVLFLGRLDPKKGIPRLVDAFESVRDELVDARLVLAGSGIPTFTDVVRRRVGHSRHADSIHMVGFLEGRDKADALAGADLFCLHSDNENFGIAPIEALRHGIPVVLSDEVYIAEDLRMAGAAAVVPSDDVDGLVRTLRRLLEDDLERGRLAARSAAASAAYDPATVAQRDAGIRRAILSGSIPTTRAPVTTVERVDARPTEPPPGRSPDRIRRIQQAGGQRRDHGVDSPHIRHHAIRSHIAETLQDVVLDVLDRRDECRVLEVGAGHPTFTDHLVSAGAIVIVTEMSASRVAHLLRRFRHNDSVRVVLDPDGSAAGSVGPVDVVACVSVLHRMPDYLGAVSGWIEQIRPGGALVSFQDPLWYPRRSRLSRLGERVASWRIPRRDIKTCEESNPSDMVGYQVLRDGVDELALADVLAPAFGEVEVQRYWSTRGSGAQRIGEVVGEPNTFGLLARRRN